MWLGQKRKIMWLGQKKNFWTFNSNSSVWIFTYEHNSSILPLTLLPLEPTKCPDLPITDIKKGKNQKKVSTLKVSTKH